MQRAMDSLSGLVERRRLLVVGLWLALLVAAVPFSLKQTDHLTSGGFTVPGSGSDRADAALHRFDGVERDRLAAVLALGPNASQRDLQAALDRVRTATRRVAHASVASTRGEPPLKRVGNTRVAIVPLHLSGSEDENADAASNLRDELGVGDGPRRGVETHLVGQQALWAGMQELSKHDLATAEKAGFPIVLIILLAVFGSLAAAALPLALGFGSVTLTGAAIYFLSQSTEMSVFVTNVASMIGIGVAVDYSLFVLARYREEIHTGASREEARRTAMRTSGVAVAFSGVTVLISLAGLFLVDSTTIRSMAMGAIVVVAISILGAITLLPALMSLLGKRAYARGRLAMVAGLVVRGRRSVRRRRGRSHPERPGFWERWTERTMRRPLLTAALSAGLLLLLAVPALSLKWGDGALRQFPSGNETRRGAELASDVEGKGAAGPALVVARFRHGGATDARNRRALERFRERFGNDGAVATIAPTLVSRDGHSALVTVTPKADPESPQARGLAGRLRSSRADPLAPVAAVHVGGPTAHVEDFKHLVSGSMWKIAVFVLAFSYVVLLLLLRSLLLPLKAVVMNLLSVAAAYGVLVTVFQYGWFDGLLGFHHLGYVNTMTPPFLLAIVFGLSMDYEVFLLTRIRERYDATGDTKRAVGEGLAKSARTISSAALIMVAVFAVFAGTGVPSIKEIGLGLSVAIALDATLVRLILVPATMELMGRWNWWLPRPLARVLPRAEFEGAARP
ncbi:MAG: putative drug exporter of the superfamily, partial [Thermoleophilaceae bacterium]|nr:putative drug exporter of the superfamily [Thermoleophilaceae bacterium]